MEHKAPRNFATSEADTAFWCKFKQFKSPDDFKCVHFTFDGEPVYLWVCEGWARETFVYRAGHKFSVIIVAYHDPSNRRHLESGTPQCYLDGLPVWSNTWGWRVSITASNNDGSCLKEVEVWLEDGENIPCSMTRVYLDQTGWVEVRSDHPTAKVIKKEANFSINGKLVNVYEPDEPSEEGDV